MIDNQIRAMFQAMVLPTMKKLPTDQLKEIRDYLNQELDNELASRNPEPDAQPEIH